MELLEKLPIIDTAAPRIGFTMRDTIDKIYEEYAKSIKISLFYPTLPKKMDGIPIKIDNIFDIEQYTTYKFIKFKVLGLIIVCIIKKREKTNKIKKEIKSYVIYCVGTNNTVDIYDNPFNFNIFSKSNVIYNGHIHKSNLPGLERGKTVTMICNTLIEYFNPESFSRIDAAEITCKNGNKFYLSWLRLLTKPTNTEHLSWYNSFGLKRISPHVSNKKRLVDIINRIKNITAKELEEYYEKVIDLFSTKKYESVLLGEYIPNGYFIYAFRQEYALEYVPSISPFNKHPKDIYKQTLKIIQQESPSTPFTEILQKASCEERAAIFNTFPYSEKIFAGFYDSELKKDAVFPYLKDIIAMSNYMVWNNRKYTFKNSSKKGLMTRKKKKKMKMELA
jgi:hypothetical protein